MEDCGNKGCKIAIKVAKRLGWLAGGAFLGTAGVAALSSRDAKKAYTHVTATALRAQDCVLKKVANVKDNAQDILEDAREINEKIYKEAEKNQCCSAPDKDAE